MIKFGYIDNNKARTTEVAQAEPVSMDLGDGWGQEDMGSA